MTDINPSLVARVSPAKYSSSSLMLAVAGIYLLFFGGHYVSGDNAHALDWAKSILDHGSLTIGAKQSVFGIGRTLFQLPFVALARLIKRVTHVSCEGPLIMLLYLANGALFFGLVYRVLRETGIDQRRAWVRGLFLGLSTVWFPLSKVDNVEPMVTTLLLALWLLASRRPWLAGFVGSWACTLRPEAIAWIGVTIAFAPVLPTVKLRMVVACLPALALTVWSNWIRSGTLTNPGYPPGGDALGPMYVGLYGILFSAGKSIFLYSPILLLYPACVRVGLSEPRTKALVRWSTALIISQVIFYSNLMHWAGDDSYGVRFLVPGVMIALIALSATPLAESRAFIIVAALGIAVQLPPVLVGPFSSLMDRNTRATSKHDFAEPFRSPVSRDDMRFQPRYAQQVATFELLWIKLTGSIPRSAAYPADFAGSTWAESFDPPLTRSDVTWDIFWLHLRSRGESQSAR